MVGNKANTVVAASTGKNVILIFTANQIQCRVRNFTGQDPHLALWIFQNNLADNKEGVGTFASGQNVSTSH